MSKDLTERMIDDLNRSNIKRWADSLSDEKRAELLRYEAEISKVFVNIFIEATRLANGESE